MQEDKKAIIDSCKQILDENWKGSYTIPAKGLYPHQWLWDSCFIAIGNSNINIEKSKTEIKNLLRGQWANGMLPHMIFADGDRNKKDRVRWQSSRNPNAPDKIATSGLTQPPMLAQAIVSIGSKMKIRERRSWYQDMFPALIAYHEWIYRERDPHNEGLALLIHPWESGLDNSPPWIDQLYQHNKPWWVSFIEKTKLDKAALLFRRDTQHVPPGQRISNIDAILYYTVMQRLRRKNWDIDAILSRSHFAIEDLTYNSILIRANQHLQDISKTIGHKLPEELIEKIEQSRTSLEKLWDGYYSQYFSRNFVTHKLVKETSIATLMPLYSGAITPERAIELVDMLHDKKMFDSDYPVASVPVDGKYYTELGYWQGPSWINTNWLIVDGLERYGFKQEADKIRSQSIAMVVENGPYEYFSAKTGKPAGAKNFSWTAALIIDFISNS